MGMKSKYLFATMMAMVAVFASCESQLESDGTGNPVRFTARTRNSSVTKTIYSGYKYTSENIERIDWENGDIIRIASDQVSEPSSKFADYTISLKDNTNQYSNATAEPFGAEHGLIWGSGTHTFYAMYPSPSTTGAQSGLDLSISGGNGIVTAVLPQDQSFASARSSKDEDYYGDRRPRRLPAAMSLCRLCQW